MSASVHLSLVLVLIPSASYLIQWALCSAVIECVLATYPCNYSLLSRAIQHTQHSEQVDVIQYHTALFWLGEKTQICSLSVFNKNGTRHFSPFTFKPVYSLQIVWWLCDSLKILNVCLKKIAHWNKLVSLFSQSECDDLDCSAWFKKKCLIRLK